MAARYIQGYSVENDNEVVQSISIKSNGERARTATNKHHVRVGFSVGGRFQPLGEWDQAKNGLAASKRRSLTGEGHLNYPLPPNATCVVEITPSGTPDTLNGEVSVEFKFNRVGAVSRTGSRRVDGDFPGAREVTKPLFSSITLDANLRDALNTSGITEFSHVIVLTDSTD